MSTERIPLPLSPYLRLPPEASLTLVTSTVNTTANWVLLRYLYAILGNDARTGSSRLNGSKHGDIGVVLVSWMRDLAFWRTEARKAVGLDLARLQQDGRFAFVDGLSELFAPSAVPPPRNASAMPSARNPAPSRVAGSQPPPSPGQQTPDTPSAHHTLQSPSVASILSTISTAVSALQTSHTLLILDTPSLLLHTTTPPITSSALSTLLLTFRNLPTIHSAIVSLPADGPFLAPAASLATAHFHGQRYVPGGRGASQESGGYEALESENAAFMVGAVQAARCVVQCRALGTGWAEDVSGVVRVTRGGCCDEEETDTEDASEPVQESEWLYYIAGDGSVKAWGRGDSGR